MNFSAWIAALRLRTLPLATASILLGVMLASINCELSYTTAFLTWLTAILLQMLSNIANDYGDSIHGADSGNRKGPSRAVQSGAISSAAMQMAVRVLSLVSLISGVLLILLAFEGWMLRVVFLLLGLISIWSAINYTAGSNPYGYRGYGDLAVLIFFGFVSVVGAYFIQCLSLDPYIFLPALSSGCLAIAVLNVNNIRDIHSDEEAGKNSIPVQIGRDKAVRYHLLLLLTAIIAGIVFSLVKYSSPWQFTFLISVPLLLKNYQAVANIQDAMTLDPYLKQMALTATLFLLLMGIGFIVSH